MPKPLSERIPPKSQWPAWMLAADREIGVREKPGEADNPRIMEYQRATRLDEQALGDETSWCAAFVSFCLRESGHVNPRFALARNFLKYGDPVAVPQFGDILVFSRGAQSWQGHVTFYVLDIGADFEVLGGNQNNSVCYSHYPKSALLGVRRPVKLAE